MKWSHVNSEMDRTTLHGVNWGANGPTDRQMKHAPQLSIFWSFLRSEFWFFDPNHECNKFTYFYLHKLQFSCLVMSDSLQPHGPKYARPPCPSPTPGAYSNSCPLNQWCHPTISSSVVPFSSHLQSFPASGSFSNESVLHIRWPKYWNFSFSISPSNEHPGLISFRIDCLDFLTVQGPLKSLLQHHSSKASILQNSAFFIVQLSHIYMTTGKTIPWTFVGKVMSLLFNMLSRFIIVFLPRNKCLLISWLQSLSTVILEPKKIACLCFYFSPSICHEVMGMDTTVFVNVVFSWLFHSPLSLSSRGSLVPLHFQP